jgi:hypothetical protein
VAKLLYKYTLLCNIIGAIAYGADISTKNNDIAQLWQNIKTTEPGIFGKISLYLTADSASPLSCEHAACWYAECKQIPGIIDQFSPTDLTDLAIPWHERGQKLAALKTLIQLKQNNIRGITESEHAYIITKISLSLREKIQLKKCNILPTSKNSYSALLWPVLRGTGYGAVAGIIVGTLIGTKHANAPYPNNIHAIGKSAGICALSCAIGNGIRVGMLECQKANERNALINITTKPLLPNN